MEALKIVLLAIGAAVVYGVLHDQVTVRVCIEYFTIGHPPLFQTDSPTVLAFNWGVIATRWVGLILGVPMACCARLGDHPTLPAAALLKPVSILLGCMAALALVAGVVGYFAASTGSVWLLEPLRSKVP